MMREIKCPNCGEVFQVDEAGYAAIVKQVRDEQFNQEIAAREKTLLSEKNTAIELAVTQANNSKDKTIMELENRIRLLEEQINSQKKDYENEKQIELAKVKANSQQEITNRDNTITQLRVEAQNAEKEKELAISKAVNEKDAEIFVLQKQISNEKLAASERMQELINQHKSELSIRDDTIAQLREFKARLSTKMVGESLEQHCQNEFNKIWMTAFPRAKFGKDNDARTGSKGDFIFRESTEDGIEFISIMFEMKNEMDTTATKHKNADFFKELDKDRNEKKCEYAVLVSNLELGNDFYDSGIVDVSYAYPKMYVIRPQCFIAMISLLRNAALSTIQFRRELEIAKAQSIDVTNFENKMLEFKNGFAYNYEQASKRFSEAIAAIDKSISDLQKARETLTKSDNQLQLANKKIDELSIKKLVRGNPTMKKLFLEAGADINNN